MKYTFEIYILSDQLEAEHWTKLYKALKSYLGVFGKFTVVFRCTDNVVRFFVLCDRDISKLSNNIEGMLLQPADPKEAQIPRGQVKERFVEFVTGGNILDLKEKYSVKKSKDLHFARFNVTTVGHQKSLVKAELVFKNAAGMWATATKALTALPSQQLAIDFATNTRYLKKTVPKYLNIEKSLHMIGTDPLGALFKVDTFPYFTQDSYLGLNSYEFDRHSFIIGASGSGKSKFISLFVDRIQATALKMNYRVIVIDPHASLADDFAHIPDKKVVNFNSESTQLFSGAATDITAATELTTTLFKSLMEDNASTKLDRVMRFSLFVLFTAQNMSLDSLKRFLTEVELRNQILQHVEGYVPANITLFFGGDFNEMRTKYYNEAIAPIIALIDEMQLQPTLVGEGELSLAKTIQDNFLTVFSLNKVSMGEKVVKTVAGLLIQQIFLLAQARAFGQRVLLVVDEVSVVQNPALAAILSEARKFNLSVILTQQYFGQIEKDLQAAIFSNVYNYYAFKVSEEDARALEGNLTIELPEELVEAEHKKGLKETDIRVKMMTELHPRECLIRVLANGQVVPAIKGRTVDVAHATPAQKAELESYKQAPAALPTKFQEGQAKAAPLPTMQSAPAPAGVFNLSELLAQQSSSRDKIKK